MVWFGQILKLNLWFGVVWYRLVWFGPNSKAEFKTINESIYNQGRYRAARAAKKTKIG